MAANRVFREGDGRISGFPVFFAARVGKILVFCVFCKGKTVRLGRNPKMNQSAHR